MAAKRYNREGMAVLCFYQPEGRSVKSSSDVEVELIDNGDGLEFRTRFTNIVSTDLIYKFQCYRLNMNVFTSHYNRNVEGSS